MNIRLREVMTCQVTLKALYLEFRWMFLLQMGSLILEHGKVYGFVNTETVSINGKLLQLCKDNHESQKF